jgi:hypothetical protein
VVTLNLTILKSSAGTDVHTACDSLIWIDGVTYKASNSTATHILTNAVGCDSLVSLDLTILASSASTLDETGQVSYISPSGKIWTESRTYNDTIPNTAGCDSVITINLTIIISGIEDYSGDQNVKYYPNPVDQELTIEFEQEFTGRVEMLDMNGRILLQQRRSNSLRTTLNTSDLPPGTYLLKLTGDGDNYLLRIIKY